MKILVFILVLLIVYQLYLFTYKFQEKFNSINKLDFDKIKPYKLNFNDKNQLIAKNKNYHLYLKDNTYYLLDKITNLMHSSYNKKTKISYFVYINKILEQYPKNISSACILGFGLGGLPLVMATNKNIKTIDCVDIDLEMFRLFKSINPNPSKKMNFYLNDVKDYIKHCENKYDVIVDDTFGVNKILVDYNKVKNMLSSKGILYINLIKSPSATFMSNLKKIFPTVYHQKANLNILIICKL